MQFEWDETKCLANIAKHGIDFRVAATIFMSDHLIRVARPHDGEVRWQAVGPLENRLIAVVYTVRQSKIRIISARRARDNERQDYRQLHAQ